MLTSLSSFLDGETEAQKSEETGSNLHAHITTEPRLELRYIDSPSTVLLFIC